MKTWAQACLWLGAVLCCVGEKAGEDDMTSTESDSANAKYEQTARERDEAQRAYTRARQEVDALLHSLQQMKAERDQAVANYQNVVRAPASVALQGNGVIGWVQRCTWFASTAMSLTVE